MGGLPETGTRVKITTDSSSVLISNTHAHIVTKLF